MQQVRAREVALQLRGIGRFAHQIELIQHRLFILGDDLDRAHAPAVGPVLLRQVRQCIEHFEVAFDLRPHAGPQHLDDDVLTARQGGAVHLGDGGRRQRRLIEVREHLAQGSGIGALEALPGHAARERRHPVLQFDQLIGDVRRQEVTTGRDRLTELDEDRSELDQRPAQILAARAGVAPRAPDPRGEQQRQAQRPI